MTDHTNNDAEDADARLAEEAVGGFAPEQIGEPRPGPGRPPLPDEETRSESIVVRVTPGDKARLVALADETGQAQSDLVRGALRRLFLEHDLLDEDGDEQGSPPDAQLADALSSLEARLDAQLDELRTALAAVTDSAGGDASR